jgi:hypothetical protein
MAIGLLFGYDVMAKDPATELVFKVTNEFIEEFTAQNGSVICSQLLKTEINSTEKLQAARQNGAFKNCNGLVGSAAEILDKLMEKYQVNYPF